MKWQACYVNVTYPQIERWHRHKNTMKRSSLCVQCIRRWQWVLSLITPHHCMSCSILSISACFARGRLLGGCWTRLAPPALIWWYTLLVCPKTLLFIARASGLMSIRPSSAPRRLSSQAINTPSHYAGTTWPLATTRQDNCITTQGLHNSTWSWPTCSIWCPRSMNATQVCRTSSSRMNSTVISVTNTQILLGLCPRVSFTKASFRK